jgi:hypothetical protein
VRGEAGGGGRSLTARMSRHPKLLLVEWPDGRAQSPPKERRWLTTPTAARIAAPGAKSSDPAEAKPSIYATPIATNGTAFVRYTRQRLLRLRKPCLLTFGDRVGRWISGRWRGKPTHKMGRLVILLALCLAGAIASADARLPPAHPADIAAAGEQTRQLANTAPHVSVYSARDLGSTHDHQHPIPCPHGDCSQCCPTCSHVSHSSSLNVDIRSVIQIVAMAERYIPAEQLRLHAWLSQLPLRPPRARV